MKKFILTTLMCVFLNLMLGSCSNRESNDGNVNQDDAIQPLVTTTMTTIKAEFLKSVNNKAVGNFTKVHFEVENYVEHTLLSGSIECNASDKLISCEAKTDLRDLKPGIYRLLLKTQHGLLGSDLFEIIPSIIPVVVTIDNESTGFYLISLITKATGIREDEIYKRVRYILGGNPNQEYDLEPTLYDLFMYYKGNENASNAVNQLSKAIQANQPLRGLHTDVVSQTLKPLY